MSSPSLSLPLSTLKARDVECGELTLNDICVQFDERPAMRGSAIRGAVTGMVLGAGLWGVIIAGVVGVFKH